MKTFTQYLIDHRTDKNIHLFYDIETLQYNEKEGYYYPSEFKNITYSLAISYIYQDKIHYINVVDFYPFFEHIKKTYKKWKTTPTIFLNAHNANKYDNHYLRQDLLFYYPTIQRENIYLRNAEDKGNIYSKKIKDITNEQKQTGILLEKRVKSSNNLELDFYLEGIRFQTVDNYLKTNMSLADLGEKLVSNKLMDSDYLKTDFNYTKYNKPYDLTNKQAREYAKEVFNQLSKDERKYIRNDVIILAKVFIHYEDLFNGFSYDKITFTSNILEFYNQTPLTSFQLLNKVQEGNSTTHIKYTDYHFRNMNFYDYLKPYYRGGLNFYNQQYVGKIIKDPSFAIDINSSYPYVMHNEKIATYLKNFKEFEKSTQIQIEWNKEVYYLYEMEKHIFDDEILGLINSRVIRQMIVKYYSTTDSTIKINSYTIKMIENIIKKPIKTLTVKSVLQFETDYFDGRDLIAEKYQIKEQGSSDYELIYHSPYDIEVTKKPSPRLSQGEIDNSKVILNGLYGIPALRPYFNLFREINGELVNIPNGFKNAERNIVFSIFVTSVALYNLLEPLTYLTEKEIDENFLYCDTDSMYLKKEIINKIPNQLFHDLHLGKWSYDETHINQLYVQNHKKYAYEKTDESNKRIIKVKSAGIPNDSFDYNMDFKTFIQTQFSPGKKITNKKSIYNKQQTISIYESKTELKQARGYPLMTYDPLLDEQKEELLNQVRDHVQGDNQTNDVLYIESIFGTFSLSEVYPVTHSLNNKQSLGYLKLMHDTIKNQLKK